MSTPLNDALVASWATRSSNRSGAPNTRLRGRRLILARIAWVTVVSLIAALFLARLPVYYTALQTVCTGAACGYVQPTLDSAQALQKLDLSVSAYATFTLALELALAFLCFTLGAVIFWRRSNDWTALLGALAVVASVGLNGNVLSMDMSTAWEWIAMGMYVFGGGMYVLVLICYYFCKPFRPRASRRTACSRTTAGERPAAPHGLTDSERSSSPGSFPGPIDDWRDVRSPTRYIRTRHSQEGFEKEDHNDVVRWIGLGRYPS